MKVQYVYITLKQKIVSYNLQKYLLNTYKTPTSLNNIYFEVDKPSYQVSTWLYTLKIC